MDITVLGRHRYAATPDTALLTAMVQVDRETPAEAAGIASGLITEVARALDTLASRGGPVTWRAIDPLTTLLVSDRTANSRREYTHRASARVRARFRDAAALARFLSDWAVHRAVFLIDVVWELSPQRREEEDESALALAVADAFRRAQTIAEAAGATNVEATGFSDPRMGWDDAPVMMSFADTARAGAGGEEPPPIIPADVAGTVIIEGHFRAFRSSSTPADEGAPRRAW